VATLAQLILNDWQVNGRSIPENLTIVTNYRSRSAGLRPRETYQASSFRRGSSLAKHLAATPPPPNFADTGSIDAVRTMSHKAAITAWVDRWHESERTSHAYTEVLRHPPDGRLCQGLAALAKAKPDERPSREAESTLFRFLTGHAFTGKYSQRFHAERALSFACKCGFSPQTVNHVVFGCPLHDAAHAANPRFDFDDRAGRPIKRLHGVLRSATRTRALLLSRNHQGLV